MSEAPVTQEQITLYSGSYCPYCIRVKRELDRLGLDSVHIIRQLRRRYAEAA